MSTHDVEGLGSSAGDAEGRTPAGAPRRPPEAAVDARIDRLESELILLREEVAALGVALGARSEASKPMRPLAAVESGGTTGGVASSPTFSVGDSSESSRARAHASAAQAAEASSVSSPVEPLPLSRPSGARMLYEEPTFAETLGLPSRATLEELVGRYLTLGLATVTGLVGVGTFLSWAIRNGYIGPPVRVALGFGAAAALAALGARIRASGTREFGNALLAMALAVAELVCWYAGPVLHVIPSLAAIAVAAIGSAVLVEFALRHDEELLCAIGFGGAALAPFLAPGAGNPLALASYGLLIVTLSSAAVGVRPWQYAVKIPMVAFVVYLMAIARAGRPPFGTEVVFGTMQWLDSRLPILFPAAVLLGLLPAASVEHRRVLLRVVAGGVLLGALITAGILSRGGGTLDALVVGVATSLMLMAAMEITRREEESWPGVDAALIPLGLLAAGLSLTNGRVEVAAVALLWTGVGLFASHRTRGEPVVEPWAATAAVAAPIAALALPPDQSSYIALELAGVGVSLALVDRWMPRRAFLFGALGLVFLGSAVAWVTLLRRAAFGYIPFLTLPSLAAAGAVLGWWTLRTLYAGPRESESDPNGSALPALRGGVGLAHRIALIGAWTTAFAFVHAELRGAWSLSASTALLIVFYSGSGVAAIAEGRRLGVRELRHIGLGLTLLAAGKVLIQAFGVPNVALRVGLFLVVSAFLIAVAYWYRRDASVEDPDDESVADL